MIKSKRKKKLTIKSKRKSQKSLINNTNLRRNAVKIITFKI